MLRRLMIATVLLLPLAAAPAHASSISVLVGDKDGFGIGVLPGQDLPWIAPIQDARSAAEKIATNGAQLTDVYSALYSGGESDCTGGIGNACSPNGDTGYVIFAFNGLLTSASITMLLGDFESLQNQPMTADVNGVPIDFFFNHGYQKTAVEVLTLTPQMIAAANAAGYVRLFLDHRAHFDPDPTKRFGSFDYIAVDYFELNAQVVPEPSMWLLVSTGLAGLVVARRRARRGREPLTGRAR